MLYKNQKGYNPLEGHKDPTSVIIGIINLDSRSLNEQQVQSNKRFNVKSVGECIIEIYFNEGKIPHFHIYNKDHSFESCIRIYENMYFSHGGKYRSVFNKSQCKQLNEYLKQPCPKFFNKLSIWEVIAGYWESECDDTYPHKTDKQPDYSTMDTFRDVI